MAYTDEDIQRAVRASAISRNQADRLIGFLAAPEPQAGRPAGDNSEEQFRLLTGLNDIFISIVLLLVLGSFLYMSHTISEEIFLPARFAGGIGILPLFESNQFSALTTAILAWLLAEYFTKKRRMALPSILLMFVFILCVFTTFAMSYVSLFMADAVAQAGRFNIGWPMIVGACGWIGFTALHWRRFKVPIGFAVGMAGLIPLSLGILRLFGSDGEDVPADIALVVLGLISLGTALWWDSRNTLRVTREADIAFWLHILAAGLIVHPLFSNLVSADTVADSVAMLVIYLALCLVSIVLDRRAFMTVSLGYSVLAANELFSASGFEQFPFAVAAFSIGGSLLVLSVMWHPVRRVVMKAVPEALKAYLPPA